MRKAIVHQHRNACRACHITKGNKPRSHESQVKGLAGIAGPPHPRSHLRQQFLVAVADHGIHPGQSRDLVWRPLRIASGHHYPRVGILPLHPPQVGARRPFGFGGHGAGIQHHQGCIRRGNGALALAGKLRYQRIAIGMAGPATEVFYVVSFHVPQSSWLWRCPSQGFHRVPADIV